MSIEIQFLEEDGFEDSIIKWSTKSIWTHCQFPVPGGFLGSDTDGGVKIRQMTDYKPVKIAIGTVECDDATAAKVMSWAYSRMGYGYDYAAVLGDLFHQSWTEKKTFDCSAFVYAALAEGGNIYLLDTYKPKWINPGQIYNSPHVIK